MGKQRYCGGKKQDGRKCQRVPGWGTKHKGKGHCVDHDAVKAEKVEGYKKGLVDKLQADPKLTIYQACKDAGTSMTTAWRARQTDKQFDKQMTALLAERFELQLQMVEDSLVARILSGKAAASETIFWLLNNSGGKYRDRRELTGPGGGAIPHEFTLKLGSRKDE